MIHARASLSVATTYRNSKTKLKSSMFARTHSGRRAPLLIPLRAEKDEGIESSPLKYRTATNPSTNTPQPPRPATRRGGTPDKISEERGAHKWYRPLRRAHEKNRTTEISSNSIQTEACHFCCMYCRSGAWIYQSDSSERKLWRGVWRGDINGVLFKAKPLEHQATTAASTGNAEKPALSAVSTFAQYRFIPRWYGKLQLQQFCPEELHIVPRWYQRQGVRKAAAPEACK